MRLNGKLVGELAVADLHQLVDDRQQEDAYLDYKRDPYGKADADKRELLKDVVGLANAAGGVILIGVEEDKSNAAVGLPGITLEANGKDPMERYERSIRDGIEPRLPGITIQAIAIGQDEKTAIAIGVPQSLNRPHRVKANGSERWTMRHNRDTIDMNYNEIRASFLDSANALERVRVLQLERSFTIRNSEHGPSRGILAIHVTPLSHSSASLDVKTALRQKQYIFPPGFSGSFPLKPNFDGVRAEGQHHREAWWGWCQLFRNGTIEDVTGDFIIPDGDKDDQRRRLVLQHDYLEDDVFEAVPAYMRGLAELGFNPPYAVTISLLGVETSCIRHPPYPNSPLDRPILLLEPVILESAALTGDWHSLLQPAFDQLWNSYGFTTCHAFDASGKWLRAKR